MSRLRRMHNQLRLGRQFILLSLLVAVLCVSHQLFMVTEVHATVMGELHGRMGSAFPLMPLPALSMPDGDRLPGERVPAPSQPLMGDCPALKAVLPWYFLVMLVLGMLTCCGRKIPPLTAPPGNAYSQRGFFPLPLLPVERRALLQVFLN